MSLVLRSLRRLKAHATVRWRRSRKRAARLTQSGRKTARAIYERAHRPTYTRTLRCVPSRAELPALLDARGLAGVGVEVGVRVARYSTYLLSHWHGGRLISIDPWTEAPLEEYADTSNVAQELQEEYAARAAERLAAFGPRSEIWRTTSSEGASRIADGTLDFVYIDARHDYQSVLDDLEAWFPKVRPGGIVAGHDYLDGVVRGTDYGVKSAVDEFFAARRLRVHRTRERMPRHPSWLVEVPRRSVDGAS